MMHERELNDYDDEIMDAEEIDYIECMAADEYNDDLEEVA